LESSWFEMYYQPKLDRSGSVMGLEALIRLRHPQLGLISPDRFIAVAEDSGLIVQIGSWALNDVSRQISVWRARGVETGRVAVNVSAAQFARGAFLAAVEDVLARWQLPGDVLELELTESLLMNNIAEARDLMQRLRHLGINFAIDDFGTGYSSLAYLQSMPVSILKIDRTFVAAASSVDGRALLTSIIDLARSLRLTVVAEGVETEVQFNVLKELGCDQFQGFLFCRPQPAHQVEDFLSRAESRSGNDIGLVSDIVPGTPTIDLETLEIAGPVN
jgi:EAL domain-containing protein (putative c-di-GMP-specific phosphodiesterase class I)